MSLFQVSVINKYLRDLEKNKIDTAWTHFIDHFHNPSIQENIRQSNEEQYQEGFLRDLFVKVLGYTLNPTTGYNLTTELKNIKDARKTDGAILRDTEVIGVIELKGTGTTDLGKVEDQAFGYKNNQSNCNYVITSNFEKLRFYIDTAVDYLEFNLFSLTRDEFDLLWLCLSADYLLRDIPLKIKKESLTQEEAITNQLYKDYSLFRTDIYENIQGNNPDHDKLTLFKKTQKLLDRFLFIFFAEDRGLLPPNSIRVIAQQWQTLKELDAYVSLYDRYKKYFHYMNVGYKGKKHDVFAYNGGLFAPDELLDSLTIDDNLLLNHTRHLSNYDFLSEVSVNILGHIFEHSLNEIEEIQAEIKEGEQISESVSRRKKEGIFYTPKHITKYIVDHTIGQLCTEKKNELVIVESEYEKERKGRKKDKIKALQDKLDTYRNWLLQLTICDPACGSGAFLNQALEHLIEEHSYIDELQAKLFDDSLVMGEVENAILENNLYGVDINEESVEIAKLSLWLRTAQKGRKLTSLNDNIKCGNSLVNDSRVDNSKAFNWQEKFPKIFIPKEKQAFHVVLTTHNSRTSQRMLKQNITKGDALELTLREELALAEIISDLIHDNEYLCLAYNSCKDHVHLILVCEPIELIPCVQKLKSMASKEFHRLEIPFGHDPEYHNNHLWSQKFFRADLDVWQLARLSDRPGYLYQDTHLDKAIAYVRSNREKHGLPSSEELKKIINGFTISEDVAFTTEYKGGFDVVIGNPPYVQSHSLDEKTKKFIYSNYKTAQYQINTYGIFAEKTLSLMKPDGSYGLIIPNYWLSTKFDSLLRQFLFQTHTVSEIVNLYEVFGDATVDTCIIVGRNDMNHEFPKRTQVKSINKNIQSISDRLIALTIGIIVQNKKF